MASQQWPDDCKRECASVSLCFTAGCFTSERECEAITRDPGTILGMYRFQAGICKACQLPKTDMDYLTGLRARQRKLPHGLLRRMGINRRVWCHHHSGKCHGRVPYWSPEEYQRRRQSVNQIRRWQWRSGQSGNPAGRPKGAKDRKPRRRPNGIAESIRAEREERAAKVERQKLALLTALDSE